MIDFENLSNESPEEIFNKFVQKIDFVNPNWNYRGESDPGITFLELFSWLKFNQHERLNRISNILKIKLLNLLGITLEKRKGSKTLLQIKNAKNNINVPRNTKWKSDSLVFENENSCFVSKSDILSIKIENPEFTSEKKYYDIDSSEEIYIFGYNNIKKGETREFTLVLSDEIPKNKEVKIYFDVIECEGRNKIENSFISFAKLKWQYLGDNGEWLDFIFTDETYQFLKSGVVSLKNTENMKSVDGFYLINCKLIESDYDFMPKISNLRMNVIEVTQKDTKCDPTFIKKKELKFYDNYIKFSVNNHLCLYGNNIIYVNKGGDWVNIEKIDSYKNIESCTFITEKYNLDSLKDDDYAFLVVSHSDDMKEKVFIGNGTGFSNLSFNLNFEDLSVYDEFKIMVGEKIKKELRFKIWNRVDDFFGSSKFSNDFVYEENLKILAFGDNHHGTIPMKEKQNIRFCQLSFTKGSNSNLRENKINDVESKNKSLKNSNIIQITPAKGGTDDETLDDAEKKINNILENTDRAVLLEDYEKIVKKTPGLIIDDISLSSEYDEFHNKVSIAVKIPGLNYITESYKENIINWMDNFRLINTEIEVLGPLVVYLDIKIKVIINPEFVSKNNDLESEIDLFLKDLNKKMGQNLIYGKLFQKIENLPYVKHVENLKITSSIEDFKDDSPYDNIIVSMNSIYSLRKADIVSLINTDF